MAYNEFAYFYDEFNGEADYDALYGYITDELKAHGITDGILADLGCGTGDLTLMLTQAGYDVIGIDRSEEMLSVLREKADELGLTGRLLLLKQDLLDLDLYGTIRAAVSTFDTYSHIGPQENFEKAIRKAAYFMEQGGVFIFDLNTPYKHRHILAGQTFDIEAEDADCHWSNRYDETAQRVDITINIDYHETGGALPRGVQRVQLRAGHPCAPCWKSNGFAVAKSPTARAFGPGARRQPALDHHGCQAIHTRGKSKWNRIITCCAVSPKTAVSCFTVLDSTEIVRRDGAPAQDQRRHHRCPGPPADGSLDDGHYAQKHPGFGDAADQGRRPRRPPAGRFRRHRQRQGLRRAPRCGTSPAG